MTVPVTLRPERPDDAAAIHELTQRAFDPMSFSDGSEPALVDRFRAADVMTISDVAEKDGRIIGHIAFTPVRADDGSAGWFALGPVSVEPELQHQGIGGKLVRAGLDQLRAADGAGCILVGNPAYYQRFGFVLAPDHCPEEEPKEYFQVLAFSGELPTTIFHFHPLFYG